MEHIYLKENMIWASPVAINLDEYFKESENVMKEILEENKNVLEHFDLKDELDEQDTINCKMSELNSSDAVDVYTLCPNTDLPTPDIEFIQKDLMFTRRMEFKAKTLKSMYTMKRRKDWVCSLKTVLHTYHDHMYYYKPGNFTTRNDMIAVSSPDIILTIDIFPTFDENDRSQTFRRPEQNIKILGSQKLSDLAEVINCNNNLIDNSKDLSDNLDSPPNCLKDNYKSSMFFLGETFYVSGTIDYSGVVKSWAKFKKLALAKAETKYMEDVRMRDLTVRLNYPYLYQHLGNCNHIVWITDARFMNSYDQEQNLTYPILKVMKDSKLPPCFICGCQSASWVVEDSDRVVFNYTPLCNNCYTKYMYVDGKKIGSFKSSRYNLQLTKKPYFVQTKSNAPKT